ncbi:hypothetical protein CPC08DRAFT_725124 [Agrocybe pediades]|nr:hypothetical protein CPC08DRAFT_725124 [Agrocybe pediades]
MSEDIPQVFVDDTDPHIVYSGNGAWVAETDIGTAPQPWNLPQRAPLYGTQHQIRSNGSLSYVFNDGTEAGIQVELEGKFMCSIHDNLPSGDHNLTITFTKNQDDPRLNNADVGTTSPPAFDGFFYTPSNTKQLQEVDVAYPPELVNMTSAKSFALSFPGDMVDFTFNGMFPLNDGSFFCLCNQTSHPGTSMALYATYQAGTNVPVGLSYSVDGGPSINFTLENPSSVPSESDQLILQTPQYKQGQHRFHLDFLGPSDQDILIDHLIVQSNPNTQKLVELQVFPALPSSATSSSAHSTTTALASPTATPQAESTSHRIGHGPVIAIAATMPALLAIFILSLLYIKRRSLRRKSATRNAGDGSEVTVTPFIPGIFARRLMYPSSKRMLDSVPDLPRVAGNVSKANRLVPPSHNPTRTAALPEPIPVSTPTPALTRTPIAVPFIIAPPILDDNDPSITYPGGAWATVQTRSPTASQELTAT